MSQISEEDRQCSDRNLFARTQCFSCKQIAEHLQRSHFSRGRRLIAPLQRSRIKSCSASVSFFNASENFSLTCNVSSLQPFLESVTWAEVRLQAKR